jgi:hypothetical protein
MGTTKNALFPRLQRRLDNCSRRCSTSCVHAVVRAHKIAGANFGQLHVGPKG